MPYIVTTKVPAGLPHGEHPHDYGYPMREVSRRPVATLDAAKSASADALGLDGTSTPEEDDALNQISGLPESGGTVLLPDGTVVEVERVDLETVLRNHVGGCREWLDEEHRICAQPSEFILWGKLVPAEGLGPRCYDHAAKHVGHHALRSRSEFALVNLHDLATDINGTI